MKIAVFVLVSAFIMTVNAAPMEEEEMTVGQGRWTILNVLIVNEIPPALKLEYSGAPLERTRN